MPADNTARLIDSARRRHELTRAKAIRALRELDRAGIPVTFELESPGRPESRDRGSIPNPTYGTRSSNCATQPGEHRPRGFPPASVRLTHRSGGGCKPPANATGNSPRTTGGSAASLPKPSASYERPEPLTLRQQSHPR